MSDLIYQILIAILVILVVVLAIGIIRKELQLKRSKKWNKFLFAWGFRENESYKKALYTEWNIKPENLQKCEMDLGKGQFGIVTKGKLKIEDSVFDVAIKSLKENHKDLDVLDFFEEYSLMKRFDHKNIIKLLGISVLNEPLEFIMEFAPLGDLKNYLLANEKSIMRIELFRFGLQVCEGLNYLHSLSILHRDLSARNVLVFEDGIVKISDFGMARNVKYTNGIFTRNRAENIPLKWMPLEAIEFGTYSVKSDVWSFGVLLWEIFSFGKEPYCEDNFETYIAKLKNHEHLENPLLSDVDIYNMMCNCWRERNLRPGTEFLIQDLNLFLTAKNHNLSVVIV